jgi:hypothetical protein
VTETVTRLRGDTAADRYGGQVADWSDPAELDIDGCAVAPRDAEEDRDNGRQAIIHGYNVYAPAGADILPTDRIRVRGEQHEVDGEPGVWTSPYSGGTKGVEIRTRKVTG